MFTPDTDITEQLQSRIDDLSAAGGGEIAIPPGVYYVRPVRLRSHIRLHLEAGARLVASGKREDYFPIGYDHNEMGDVHSAFFAFGAERIAITGQGTIDLNCWAFYGREDPSTLPTVGPEVTPEHLAEATRPYQWRPNQPMFFQRCRDLRIDGVRIVDAPCWTMSFDDCDNVKVTDATIDNPPLIPNSDGMHFTGSRDILVSGCHITAGDDCVALSGITDWYRPCENAVISNCVFQSASKAISVGYMHSVVRNVRIENVIIKRSNRAFVIMCHPRTGLVEHVRVSNCILEGRSYGGNWWGNGEPVVIMVTPHHIERYRDPLPEPRFDCCVRNVEFAGVTCRAERPIAVIASEPLTRNIRVRDCTVDLVPEEKPSLMGNVIDLSPGEEHYQIEGDDVGVVSVNADVRVHALTNGDGEAVRVIG